MYQSRPSIVYGFHGTDKNIAFRILNKKTNFIHSNNNYDWLGNGIYFWENDLERARKYALIDSKRKYSKIKKPVVLGAILELGNCLDLLDQKGIDIVKAAYQEFKEVMKKMGAPLPQNTTLGNNDFDFKARELDCAVIRYASRLAQEEGCPFDSVRSAFIEGMPLYEGAMFHEENHIQLAIINPDCIKGIFLPRKRDAQNISHHIR
jgi:hypothetical protein